MHILSALITCLPSFQILLVMCHITQSGANRKQNNTWQMSKYIPH